MDCPRCQKPLLILEFEQIEIDYCVSCQGVWLDSKELGLLLGSPDEVHLLFHADSASKERPLRCPQCRKKMEKVRGGEEEGVFLDRCQRGHGIWFDGGEVEALLRDRKSGFDHRIFEHFKGIFIKKAKSMDTGEKK